MKIKYSKITFLFIVFTAIGIQASSAQVGVGTIAPTGALDVTSATNGFVPPRVALTALNAAAPIVNPQGGAIPAGTIVWNTVTANIGAAAPPNNITPGLYYWNGAKWIAFAGSTGGLDWSLTGNASTVPGTNFVGTTDVQDLQLRTSGLQRMTINTTGQTVINNPTAAVGDLFSSYGATNNWAVNGYSTGASGVGVYGSANGATGFGVFASNTNVLGTGIIAAGNNAGASYMTNGSGIIGSGTQMGVVGLGKTITNGWGVLGAGNNALISTLTQGGGGSFSGNQWGVFANATLSGSGTTDRAAYIGNFNENATARTVYLGARIGGVNYKVLGTGSTSVSTTMPTRNGERILFAPEAPENWFFDIGEVQLVNGKAIVTIDPIFVDCIADSKPFKVFVQGGENTLGSIRISRNQKEKTFVVEDLGGASNGTVQYSIYAIWKQKENLRFPEYKQSFEIIEHKTENASLNKNLDTKK